MTILEQTKVNENHEARAPYNFVPLPEMVVTLLVDDLPDQGIFDSKRHTGYIDCELTTSSPVFIRAGLKPEQAKAGKESKDFPEFFYLNSENQPVIPGSSLRGLLRTLVEIVTFSKIGAVTKNPLVYRSVGGTTNHDAHYRDMMMQEVTDLEARADKNTKFYIPRMRGGYMVKKGSDWAIQPAKVIDGTTYAHIGIDEALFRKLKRLKNCQNAYEVFITTGPYNFQEVRGGFLKIKFAKVLERDASQRTGLRPAALARSGWMNSKKSEAVIYESDPQATALPLTDEQIDAYRDQISKEQQKLLGDHGVLNDGQPVFYLEKDGKVVFFGHTRMFRVPYPNSPFDYVPDYARPSEEPKEPDLIDFAEAMFGYTRKVQDGTQRQRAYAGRVSCSDAKLIAGQKEIWLSPNPVKPHILSGPKPTTFQHYMVQIDPNLYEVGRPRPETRLRDYESSDDETAIRGHKFYWHKGDVGVEDIREKGQVKDQDTQHTSIKPLKTGVRFNFQVHFENLTSEELGALMWVFDQAAKENMRLKIGMGKPLGMGAIKIVPTLYTTQPKERYASLIENSKWADGTTRQDNLALKSTEEFSNRMLVALNEDVPSEKQLKRFTESRRILALLTMLQWPGPDKEWTRYMEIEHPDSRAPRGKVNEYKERPVLPSPFGVWSKHKP